MSQDSLDSRWTCCSLWRVQYVQKSLPQDNQLKPTPSGLSFRTFLGTHLMGSFTRTPKYSCRDCWTGDDPMKNDQQEPDPKSLWGLKKEPLTNKPKEERILDTVNRVITRIQNDERNYLWRNTHTKPVSDFQKSSRKKWLPSVTGIKSTTQIWCVVQYQSSSRLILRTLRIMGNWCSSDSSDNTLCVSDNRIPRKSYGHYDPKDPVSPRHRVFFRPYGKGSEKGESVVM